MQFIKRHQLQKTNQTTDCKFTQKLDLHVSNLDFCLFKCIALCSMHLLILVNYKSCHNYVYVLYHTLDMCTAADRVITIIIIIVILGQRLSYSLVNLL